MPADIIPPPEPSPRSLAQRAVFVLGIALLFAPAIAFVLGQRAEPIENRPLAERPGLADGWNMFPLATAWATDHLPLRQDAIELNDALIEQLFSQPPAQSGGGGPVGTGGQSASLEDLFPRVIEGKDGWLYYGGDMKAPCLAEQPVSDVVDDLRGLHDLLEASGRRLVVVVASDKSSVLPEHLPDDVPGEGCAKRRKEEMRRTLAAVPGGDEWLIDLRDPLLERQRADGIPIYRQQDTHWTPRGGAVMGQELMARLQPGMTSYDDLVTAGTRDRQGDLATLLGREGVDTYDLWELDRAGVTSPEELPPPGAIPLTVHTSTTNAPLFEPQTLVLGDSFLAASRPVVYPFFANMRLMHTLGGAAHPDRLATEVARAQVVVVEIVERDLVGDPLDILSGEVRAALERALS
jgi:alginate O-acetyltransferase complex protein AlgJ